MACDIKNKENDEAGCVYVCLSAVACVARGVKIRTQEA